MARPLPVLPMPVETIEEKRGRQSLTRFRIESLLYRLYDDLQRMGPSRADRIADRLAANRNDVRIALRLGLERQQLIRSGVGGMTRTLYVYAVDPGRTPPPRSPAIITANGSGDDRSCRKIAWEAVYDLLDRGIPVPIDQVSAATGHDVKTLRRFGELIELGVPIIECCTRAQIAPRNSHLIARCFGRTLPRRPRTRASQVHGAQTNLPTTPRAGTPDPASSLDQYLVHAQELWKNGQSLAFIAKAYGITARELVILIERAKATLGDDWFAGRDDLLCREHLRRVLGPGRDAWNAGAPESDVRFLTGIQNEREFMRLLALARQHLTPDYYRSRP